MMFEIPCPLVFHILVCCVFQKKTEITTFGLEISVVEAIKTTRQIGLPIEFNRAIETPSSTDERQNDIKSPPRLPTSKNRSRRINIESFRPFL